MCGLVGVAGLVTGKEEKAFRDLLIIDTLRGVDSTGIAVIPRNGDVKVHKAVGNAWDLVDDPRYEIAMRGMHRAIIGHNRYGTMGGVTKANAHPFEFDGLVGAHNGTLITKWKLHQGNDFKVDSAALYNHLNEFGLKDLMKVMGGAWALTWWDKNEQTINFLRNKERPLWMVYTADKKALFWASEAWMLFGALSRQGIEMGETFQLGEDAHMSIAIKNNGDMEKPHVSLCPSTYITPVTTTYYGNQSSTTTVGQSRPSPQQQTQTLLKEEELKKAGVVPETTKVTHIGSKAGYANLKNRVLQVLSHVENDGYGGKYLSCYDEEYVYATIRWYYPREIDPDTMIGEEIMCDIGGRVERLGDPAYYKVLSSSVVSVEETTVEVSDPHIPAEEKEYEDARGRSIGYDQWIAKHGECTFCSDLILPTDAHAFNSAGQCFCSSCMRSDEVRSYTSFTRMVA